MPDIDFQKIVLNLIPKREDDPVVFYASQYETTRRFIADLMWGDSEFAPGPDHWAEIDIRKNDDNLVVITDDVSIDNNELSVILPVQAVTCIGKNLGQIKIYAGEDQFVAAFNFILEVQPDPLAGGVTSDTAIDNLTQQIEDIATEVIGEDYYNKTETDALLADKADKSELPDMTNYYTKTQTDNLLNDKADRTDLATLASKAEVTQAISDEDTAVKNWVSSHFATPGYVATHYYTKLQVDDIINNMLPVGSASGNPCTFDTEYPYLIQGLKADIVCGGGGGTPSTPIPLVGHSELNLWRLSNDNRFNGTFNTIVPIYLPEGATICASCSNFDSGSINIRYYDIDGVEIDYWAINLVDNTNNRKYRTFSMVKDAYFCKFDGTGTATDYMVTIGNTSTPYEPYNGDLFTVAFGQTVYGGIYDKSGRLTITHGYVDLGTCTWGGGSDVGGKNLFTVAISDIKRPATTSTLPNWKIEGYELKTQVEAVNYNNVYSGLGWFDGVAFWTTDYTAAQREQLKSDMSGIHLCYELATPIVIDVPSISVFAENGVNNIISDCGGDVNVSYKDTIQHYIDERL